MHLKKLNLHISRLVIIEQAKHVRPSLGSEGCLNMGLIVMVKTWQNEQLPEKKDLVLREMFELSKFKSR